MPLLKQKREDLYKSNEISKAMDTSTILSEVLESSSKWLLF